MRAPILQRALILLLLLPSSAPLSPPTPPPSPSRRSLLSLLPLLPLLPLPPPPSLAAPSGSLSPAPPLTAPESVLTSAFSRCAPSVAYVDVFLESPSADGLRVRVPRGTGSGFVWDEQGRVVTNYHVVRGYVNPALPAVASPAPPAERGPPSAALRKALLGNPVIEVTVGSQTLRASVVGFDVDKDIAVLQLPPFDPATRLPRAFPPIERLHGSFERLGSEGAAVEPLPLLVGQTALAIGAPYGLSQSLSVGIISGLNRSFRSPSGRLVTGCIQTDCAVNPGNSGGPLLSSAGTLIGMTSAIESPTGASAGIAFAVPYDALSYVVSLLIKYGKVTRPVLGATYLAAEKSEQIGIADGVLVVDVFKSSPAYAAGLRRTESGPGSGVARLGDVILSLDGERVRSEGELNQAIARKKVGDRVALADPPWLVWGEDEWDGAEGTGVWKTSYQRVAEKLEVHDRDIPYSVVDVWDDELYGLNGLFEERRKDTP